MRPGSVVLSIAVALALTGCSLTGSAPPVPAAGAALQGRVHGGQQPVSGAHVYLFQANHLGYGGPGIAASALNASVSLLNAADTGYADSVGAYVPTTANGSFSISGDYSCTPGSQVYLYALGGNPGSGVNSAAGFLAVLGTCPSASTLAGTVPSIWVNEVSTVAAAYSMAGFATDALHVSSAATAQSELGLANAFANAANLADIMTGLALATPPSGNGLAPQAKTDTLANMLAACVNSTGPSSSACSTLFSNATNGGTLPTDTATAAINIAHAPGTGVVALCGLQPSIGAPFLPDLPCVETGDYPNPTDLSLALQFTGGGIDSGTHLAVDASGNVWIANSSGNSVTELSSSGTVLSGKSGFTGGGLNDPSAIALDANGNAWIANYNGNSVTEISGSGTLLSGTAGYPAASLCYANSIALDASGDAWVTNGCHYNMTVFSSSGSLLSPVPSTGNPSGGFGYDCNNGYYAESCLGQPDGVAVDSAGRVWVVNFTSGYLAIFSSASGSFGTITALYNGLDTPYAIAMGAQGDPWIVNQFPSTVDELNSSAVLVNGAPFSGGNISTPSGIAVDGAGNAWVANSAPTSDSITELSPAGLILSGSKGYAASCMAGPSGIAVDGSGNVWVGNSGEFVNCVGYGVTEFLGAAVPVVTPIAAGVVNGTLGTRP